MARHVDPAAMAALLTRNGFTVTRTEHLLDTARRLVTPTPNPRSPTPCPRDLAVAARRKPGSSAMPGPNLQDRRGVGGAGTGRDGTGQRPVA